MSLPFWDNPEVRGRGDGTADVPGLYTAVPPAFQGGAGTLPDELSRWDFIILNGTRAPGICRLEGGRHIGYSREVALGIATGQPPWVFGFDPVEFSLVLTLWTPRQFQELEAMLPNIMPKAGPAPDPRAVTAEHPALALVGVDTIYFESMELPRHIGKQVMEVTFQCYEFKPEIPMEPRQVRSALPDALNKKTEPQPKPSPMPSQNPIPP